VVWTTAVPSKLELRELKRAELVKAAARYFTQCGYHRTTLADVAKALGLTKSAIYHYFPDKQSLLGECAKWGHESILAIPDAKDADSVHRLRMLCLAYAEAVSDNGLGFVVFCDLAELSNHDRVTVLRLRRRIDARFRDIMKQGMREGALTSGDPSMRAMSLLGALNWMARWHSAEGRLKAGEVAGMFFEDWLEGAAAKKYKEPGTRRREARLKAHRPAPVQLEA
jgi:TetR/AcrR family transcriptional regulator